MAEKTSLIFPAFTTHPVSFEINSGLAVLSYTIPGVPQENP